MTVTSSRRALVLAAAVAATTSLFSVRHASAANTWSATATTGTWETAANWVGGVPGTPGTGSAGDTATFNNNSASRALTLNVDRTLTKLLFTSSAVGSYSIGAVSGTSLYLVGGGNITFDVTATGANLTQTLNAPLIISAAGATSYAFSNNATDSSSILSIGGSVTGATSGLTTLTLGGTNTGNNLANGVIANSSSGGTLALSKTGAGKWTIAGANTFTGTATVSAGTLVIGNAKALQNASAITVSASCTLDLNGYSINSNGIALSGSLLNGSTTPAIVTAAVTPGSSGGIVGGIGDIELDSVLNGKVLTKTGNSTLILGGTAANSVALTVTGGSAILTKSNALASANSVTVGTGTSFSYAATTDAQLAFTGLAITGGGTTIGASIGANTTSAEMKTTGAATTTAAAVAVNMYGIPGVTPAAGTNTYTLIHGGAGSSLNNATYSLGTVYNNSNFTVGTLAKSATDLQVSITRATPLASAYWNGTNKVWAASNGSSSSNWAASNGGAVQALVPGAGTDVVIVNAGAVPTGTSLGADMSIKGLTISDTTNGLGLNSDRYTLTLGGNGLTVDQNVPSSAIAAKIALGAGQAWTNNSANPLTVSGPISGGFGLSKAGSGTIALAGANTYSGTTTVSAGTLQAIAANTLSSSSAMVISGGALTSTNAANTVASLALNSGSLGLTTSTLFTVLGASTFGSGSVSVNGTATDGNIYTVLHSIGSITGAPANGSVPDGWGIVVSGNDLNLQHKPRIGLSATLGAVTDAFVNRTINVTGTLSNIAPSNSQNLAYGLGSTSGSSLAFTDTTSSQASVVVGSPRSLTGTINTGSSAGASKTWGITASDSNATNSGQQASGTINVWDHASATSATPSISLGNHHVGYISPVTAGSVDVGNLAGYRVALNGSGAGNNHVSLNGFGNLAAGSSTPVSATLATGRLAGQINESLDLTYSDALALPGALSNFDHTTFNVTGNIYTGKSTYASGGSWNSFSNWQTAGGVPGIDSSLSAGADTATFDNTGAGAPSVSLDTDVQLNKLTINSGTSYTISGSSHTMTFSGAGAAVDITGVHSVGANMNFASSTTVTVSTGSTATLTGTLTKYGTVLTFTGGGSVDITGKVTGNTGSPNSDLVVDGATVTFSSGVSDYYGPTVIQNGGKIILTTDNALPGSTTVTVNSGSTLDVGNHTLSVASLNVDSTATLAGTGTISAPVTITGTGAISPAGTDAIGTLSSSSLGGTGVYFAELGNHTADKLVVTGQLDISSMNLDLSSLPSFAGNTFVIAHYDSLLTNDTTHGFAGVIGLPTGASINYNYAGGTEIAVSIPEPAAAMIVTGLASAGLLARRRRSTLA